jgi:site-specific DNA recombinase
VEQKRMKLLAFNAQGKLDDADFLAMNKQCSAEAKSLQAQLDELTAQQESAGNMKQQLDTIRTVLRNAQKDAAKGVITKEFVARYIDKIFVTPEEDGSLRLDIKIFTGESCEKHLQSLRRQAAAQTFVPQAVAAFSPSDDPEVSTGHTVKKMIESYEKNL